MSSDMGYFTHSVSGCLEAAIGPHGLPPAALRRWLGETGPHLARLKEEAGSGRLPFLTVALDEADLDAAKAALARLLDGADTLVFFGTGGSGLGGQTLASFAAPLSCAAGEIRTRPALRFYDNLDPAALDALLAACDFLRTRFVLTSKSGGTAETLAQAIVTISAVENALGPEAPSRLFLGLTEPAVPGRSNGLRSLCARFGIPVLDHHPGIGGRFSCLSNVGLLPALAANLDARAVRAGARRVLSALLSAGDPAAFAPALGAAVAAALAKEKGIRVTVLMPYADRLERLAAWFVQLWAESLGKNGEGTSPVAALGPRDQHSQLQLFMEGPPEIAITLLRLPLAGTGPVIGAELAEAAGAGYMAGKHVGDIVEAQGKAMAEALVRAGRPVRTIDICQPGEEALGALLAHFMIETVLAGRLLGIDPFDQPGVELAKTLTRQKLTGHLS